MRKVLSIVALLVVMLTGGAGMAQAAPVACEHEDSANCYWDASERGNGDGRSFTDIDGVAHYWDEAPVVEVHEDGSTTALTGPASIDSAEAWELWDAVGAAELLPSDGAMVTYAGAYDGHALSAAEVAVWGADGTAYLFTLS